MMRYNKETHSHLRQFTILKKIMDDYYQKLTINTTITFRIVNKTTKPLQKIIHYARIRNHRAS